VIIQFESVVIAVKTAQCRWKLWYVPKFTAASRATPCDSTASCHISEYNSWSPLKPRRLGL